MSIYKSEELDKKPVLKRLRKLYEPVRMKTESMKESSANCLSNITDCDILDDKKNMGSISYSWDKTKETKRGSVSSKEISPPNSPSDSLKTNSRGDAVSESNSKTDVLVGSLSLQSEPRVNNSPDISKAEDDMREALEEHRCVRNDVSENSRSIDVTQSDIQKNDRPESRASVSNCGDDIAYKPNDTSIETNSVVDGGIGLNDLSISDSDDDLSVNMEGDLKLTDIPDQMFYLPVLSTVDCPGGAEGGVSGENNLDNIAHKLTRKKCVKKFQFPSETASDILDEGDLLQSLFHCSPELLSDAKKIEKSFEIMDQDEYDESWGESEHMNSSEEVGHESQENISLSLIRAVCRLDSEQVASEMDDVDSSVNPPLLEALTDAEMFDALLRGELVEDPEEVFVPSYPVGPETYAECPICFQLEKSHLRTCCGEPFCHECMVSYVTVKVTEGQIKMECPHNDCSTSLHRDEIYALLDIEHKEKFYRYLINANLDPHKKTCPNCSNVYTIEPEQLAIITRSKRRHRKRSKKAAGLQVECSECNLLWCFVCHAPWHEGINCAQFQRGDKLVKMWAHEQHYGQVNAQNCPKCKVFINRSSGCDHMVCNQCDTEFCYRCGETFRSFKFIGNHYAKLSIFGCKYRYKPDQPHQRRFVRGTIFGLKILAAPLVAGLAAGALAVLAGVGVIALPIWGGVVLHKRVKRKKEARRRAEAHKQWRKHMEELDRDPYLEMFHRQRGVNIESDNTATWVTSSNSDADEEVPTPSEDNFEFYL